MDTSHSPTWSENSFPWGPMVLAGGEKVKRWGQLNRCRNWVSASAPPYPHIGVLGSLCFKLSSTGLQDRFGTQVGKLSRAPTQQSPLSGQATLHPIFHPSFLFSTPKAQNPPSTLVSADENMTTILFHVLIQSYHVPGTIWYTLCVWNKFNLRNKPIY